MEQKAQMEAWAIDVLEEVQSNRLVEDSLVECKSTWIDPIKAARLLAGHANAAARQKILWLIGVDEKKGIVGVPRGELAEWFPKVQACFADVAPDLFDLNISFSGKQITALFFYTDRAPYLTKNPHYGIRPNDPIEFEVPWRSGRRTKTAARADLLRLLYAQQPRPNIEVLTATLDGRRQKSEIGEPQIEWVRFGVIIELYLYSLLDRKLVIPFHRCSGILHIRDWGLTVPLRGLHIGLPQGPIRKFDPLDVEDDGFAPKPKSLTVEASIDEILISGPGRIWLTADADIQSESVSWDALSQSHIEIQIVLQPCKFEYPITFEVPMVRRLDSVNETQIQWLNSAELADQISDFPKARTY